METMMENGIIYRATNINNGKIYIGKTLRPLNIRIQNHMARARSGHTAYFYNAIRKYGADAFKWDILTRIEAVTKKLTNEYLNILEKEYIEQYKSYIRDNGYNMSLGGEGLIPNEELRKVLKKKAIERGKRREYREKMSRAKMGKKKLPMTEEQKDKLSKATKRTWTNPDIRKRRLEGMIKHRTKIKCLETGKIYKSIAEAARENNVCGSNIGRALAIPYYTTKGLHWVKL